jgi:hypothetical protein
MTQRAAASRVEEARQQPGMALPPEALIPAQPAQSRAAPRGSAEEPQSEEEQEMVAAAGTAAEAEACRKNSHEQR